MKSAEILLEKLKDAGVKDAEKIIVDLYGAIQAALPEIVAHPESEAAERAVAGVAIPVFAALKPAVENVADLNKDGKIG